MRRNFVCAMSISLFSAVLLGSLTVQAEELTGADIVQRCDKEANAGADQRNLLTVILRDASGNEKKNVYQYRTKNYYST